MSLRSDKCLKINKKNKIKNKYKPERCDSL